MKNTTLQDILNERLLHGLTAATLHLRVAPNGQPAFSVQDVGGKHYDFMVVRNDVFSDRNVARIGG